MDSSPSLSFYLEEAEDMLIDRALSSCDGNKSRVAELLGITREGSRKKLLRRGSRKTETDGVRPSGDEA